MPKHHKPRWWRLTRIYFRRFRIAVWLVLLAITAGFVYVNQIGLPAVVKRPLLEKLRSRGVDLQFARLRLRWIDGIVAENVVFGITNSAPGSQFTVKQVQVDLNSRALTRLKLQIDSLVLEDGTLRIPVASPDPEQGALALEDIRFRLRFMPGDQWALDDFTARLGGARLKLSGNVTNASHVRKWRALTTGKPKGADRWEKRLARASDLLDRIRFRDPPEIVLSLKGDAADLSTFAVRFSVTAPDAETPWGTIAGGRVTAHLSPADPTGAIRADLSLVADKAYTPWASAENVAAEVRLESTASATNLVNGRLKLSVASATTEWVRSHRTDVVASWVHSITNPVPLSGECRIDAARPVTSWAEAEAAMLTAEFWNGAAAPGISPPAPSWGWWTNLHPYRLTWACEAKGALCRNVRSEAVSLAGTWNSPELVISNLEARVSGGRIDGSARLRVDSRELTSVVQSTADPSRLLPLLTPPARKWLSQFSWSNAPFVEGSLAVVLPSWTNHAPDWRGEVQPTVRLSGRFDSRGPAGYRNVAVSRAGSSFVYSNLTWTLPDLVVSREEGQLRARYQVSNQTRDFQWHLTSAINPAAIAPLLATNETRAFELARFTSPPVVEADVWGRLYAPERTGVKALVTVTNFSFRGETFDTLGTALEYTNKVLQCLSPRVTRGDRSASADSVIADFESRFVFLTNALSNLDPMAIARAIGPKVGHAIEPYRFDAPPNARVNGAVPMKGEEGANLRFELDGGPFHWWKFNFTRISGLVHWQGHRVSLRDVAAGFYEGQATGFGNFFFGPESRNGRMDPNAPGTDFEFGATVTNALLQFLVADVFESTNQLEGRLSGSLSITSANSEDWRTVQGYGAVSLRDGLIWDTPIFGVVSPLLNAISPGLGNSRATAATSNFTLTNGVIHTADMDMRCQGMRLRYNGSVDLEGRVDTRVEAELLRDVWVVGPLVSTVFWPVSKMFEYRVRGTLSDPQAEPVYVLPKLMFLPFRTIRGLFPDGSGSARTNAPPSER